jgi:hypothetical protein
MRPLLLCLFLPAVLVAQSTTWTAEADFNSRYLWRGIAYSKGPVFQPSFWVKHGNSTVSLWSNLVLNNEPKRGQFDQLFFTVSHELVFDRWRLEPAIQGYTWRGLRGESSATTAEVSVKLTRAIGPFRVVTSSTVDIASYRGAFIADAGLEWGRAARQWQLEASAITAWANSAFNRTYVGVDRNALNYLQFTVSATRKSKRGWYLRPHAEAAIVLSKEIARALNDRVLGNVGLAFGREF